MDCEYGSNKEQGDKYLKKHCTVADAIKLVFFANKDSLCFSLPS
jgi:hypothetical protein